MNCKPFLSIVIPCYNEADNLNHGVLTEVLAYLKTAGFRWELIISDDGSTDASRELVRSLIGGVADVCLVENVHAGKPAAILSGIRKARGEFVLFTDMDQSTPLRELEKLLPYFVTYPVIIGSRLERKNFPFYRKLGSVIFRLIRKAFLLPSINDTQCGFKVFQTRLAAELFPKLQVFREPTAVSGWKVTAFDVELLYLAVRGGHEIKEVLVEWEDRDHTSANAKGKSYIKESLEMLSQIIKVKLNAIRGYYK